MMYFEDLSEYRYGLHPAHWTASGPPIVRPQGLYSWRWDHPVPELAFDCAERNIGWLDSHHDYPRGPSDEEFVVVLERICQETGYHLWRGNVPCLLCGAVLPGRLGAAEIRIQGTGVVYAAPNLVHHYVACHGYLPAPDFMDSVVKSQGRQAQPVSGTTRGIPEHLLVREPVTSYALRERVVGDIRAKGEADEMPDVSILRDGDFFVVEATLAPRGVTEQLVRAWNVPEDAVLNLEQGSYGIRTMLTHALDLRKEELFRKGKEPFLRER